MNLFKNKNSISYIQSLKYIFNIIIEKDFYSFYSFLILTLFGAILELIGIGLIIPIFTALSSDQTNNYINNFQIYFGIDKNFLYILIMLILLLFFIMKGIYLAFLSFKQSNYIFNIKSKLSNLLYSSYIESSYEFHLEKNSSNLIAIITSEVQQFVGLVLVPFVLLITEILVLLFIASLIFIIHPIGALLSFLISISSIYLFQNFTKNKLINLGINRQKYESLRIKNAQEGLSSIKELKLYSREDFFISTYFKYSNGATIFERKHLALSQLPRIWLEIVGVLSLSILVISMILFPHDNISLLSILMLFGASAFRLLPSANRILDSIQSLRYSDAVVHLIAKELYLTNSENAHIIHQSPASLESLDEFVFELKDISFEYRDGTKVLQNVNFKLKFGDCVGFIGESGSGKTTLINIMLTLLSPTSGVLILNGNIINKNHLSWKSKLGYVSQNIYLMDSSILENILFGSCIDNIDWNHLNYVLDISQLSSFVDNLPNGIYTNVGEHGTSLSGGQRQRIGIARALYSRPEVLFLDEATSSLDNLTSAEIITAISKLKGSITIVMIAHNFDTLHYCDSIYKVSNKTLIAL